MNIVRRFYYLGKTISFTSTPDYLGVLTRSSFARWLRQEKVLKLIRTINSFWCAWRDLNAWPQPSEGCTLIQLSYKRSIYYSTSPISLRWIIYLLINCYWWWVHHRLYQGCKRLWCCSDMCYNHQRHHHRLLSLNHLHHGQHQCRSLSHLLIH